MVEGNDELADLAESIAELAIATNRTVGVGESLTGGALSAALASAPDAGEWYAGAVVAYHSATKQRLLGVAPGPVVTSECAGQMAGGVRELLAVDVSAALTGVGGPEEREGRAPGTVYLAIASEHGEHAAEHHFSGSPARVVELAVHAALQGLRETLERLLDEPVAPVQ